MPRRWPAAVLTATAIASMLASRALATVLPLGFVETKVVGDLVSPTTTVHAGDGRIFVAEQDGRVRIVKNGVLLAEPFVQLDADNVFERGLLGINARSGLRDQRLRVRLLFCDRAGCVPSQPPRRSGRRRQ